MILLLALTSAFAEPRDDARRHFAAGLEAARTGDYELALQRFLDAQNAWPHPATLYNIARAQADLGRLEDAVETYRLYQEAAPEKAADVAPVIAVLEARIQRANAPVPEPSPQPAPVPVAPPPASSQDAATAAQIAALAAQIAALSQALGVEVPNPVPAPAPVPVPAPQPEPLPEPLPEPDPPEDPVPTGDFLTDAYERRVVTASRIGQAALDSPSTITVLTADDLLLSATTTLPDLLRRVPGVDVMSLSSGQPDVSIRGFNRELANKVLVLVDGRSTYMDFLGATLWETLPVSPDAIERIEIIRGPGSAVYGANAVTGVINIITKTPGETPRTVVRARGGSPSYAAGNAVTSGRSGATSWRLGAGAHQVGRWAKGSALEQDLGLRVLRADARVDRSLGSGGFVSVQGGLAEAETLEFFNIGALGSYEVLGHSHHTLRADAGWDRLHLRAFWNHDDALTRPYAAQEGSRSLEARYAADTVDLEAEVPLAFETGPVTHALDLGFGYRRIDVRFGYLQGGFDTPAVQDHLRVFVDEQASVGPVRLVASLRLDKHPLLDLGQTLSPRGAVIWRALEKTSVRATVGTAFRQPTTIESYMDLALPTSADGAFIRDLGNTELAPERITTVELGLHDESTYRHAADVVLYYNRVSDLISLDSVTRALGPYDPGFDGYQAGTTGWVNQAPVYHGLGMEAELEVYPADGLDLYGNVALSRVLEVTDGVSTVDGSSPLAKVNVGAAWRTPWSVDLSAGVHVVSSQVWRLREFDEAGQLGLVEAPLPARTVLDARVAARPLRDEPLELAAGLWNALGLGPIDRRFREHPKGHPVGAVAFGEVSYAF